MNLSAIVFEVAVSILARKLGKQYVCRTTSETVWLFSGTQPICCSPSSVKQNTPVPYVVLYARVLLKNASLPTFPTTRLAPKNLDVPLTGNLILLGVLFACTGLKVSAGSELMESEALSHFSTWQGLICQNNMKLVMLRLMTEIPALNFIITVKGGRKISDYKRISD